MGMYANVDGSEIKFTGLLARVSHNLGFSSPKDSLITLSRAQVEAVEMGIRLGLPSLTQIAESDNPIAADNKAAADNRRRLILIGWLNANIQKEISFG